MEYPRPSFDDENSYIEYCKSHPLAPLSHIEATFDWPIKAEDTVAAFDSPIEAVEAEDSFDDIQIEPCVPLPTQRTIVVNIDTAVRMIPSLLEVLDGEEDVCDDSDSSMEQGIQNETAHQARLSSFHTQGPVLVARLPEQLENCLERLLDGAPEPLNIESLDLRESYTVGEWSAQNDDGQSHTVFIPMFAVQRSLFTTHDVADNLSHYCGRIAFVAGKRALLSEFWVDDDYMDGLGAAFMCHPRYRDYSEEEQQLAEHEAKEAGSPTPWMFKTWRDKDGTYWTGLQCKELC